MQLREDSMTGRDGVTLHARAWLPDGPPRALLVIAHGLGEHSGRYAGLVARCVARGIAVHALDHRGHGRSGGPRAQVGRFAWLVEDLAALLERAGREHPGARRFLLGHSMGGAIALTLALDRPAALDGLILSAPAIAPPSAVSPLTIAVVRLLSALWRARGAIAGSPEDLSRDPQVVQAYVADPLVLHGPVPARTLAELFEAMRSLPRRAASLDTPVLVLQGTADRIVMHADVRPVFASLGGDDRTVKVYRGLYHELLNEPEREQVLGDLLAWLDARC